MVTFYSTAGRLFQEAGPATANARLPNYYYLLLLLTRQNTLHQVRLSTSDFCNHAWCPSWSQTNRIKEASKKYNNGKPLNRCMFPSPLKRVLKSTFYTGHLFYLTYTQSTRESHNQHKTTYTRKFIWNIQNVIRNICMYWLIQCRKKYKRKHEQRTLISNKKESHAVARRVYEATIVPIFIMGSKMHVFWNEHNVCLRSPKVVLILVSTEIMYTTPH